ncbi:MAG: lysophospholipid acyltransferase family protein [Terriglobales bacterium]
MRTVLTLGWWTLMTPVAGLLTLPYTLLTGDTRFLWRVGMWVVRTGVRIAGVRVEIVGRDKLDLSRNYIFMSNHVSNLDPPLLIPNLPRQTSILVKKELFRIPILGFAMRAAKLVPVDRSNRDAAIASVREAAEVMQGGFDMTVYPEGTRSPDGRLLPFKKGPFYLALETGFPIVPITLLGTFEISPKGKFFIDSKAAAAQIVFHDPIWPKDYRERDALIEAVRQSVASALPPERR